MCTSEAECGGEASCVAGRCAARAASAAIDTARRLVGLPVDVAYVTRAGARCPVVVGTLGGGDHGDALLLLRFAVDLPPEAQVLEAYLLLERATPATPIAGSWALHAAEVVDPWTSRSVSWAKRPRVREVDAPIAPISPAAGPLVRLDVRGIVQRWRARAGDDFGIAVLAEGRGPSGVALALAPTPEQAFDPVLTPAPAPQPALSPFEPHPVAASAIAEPRRELFGPRLELYVK
jgi:hypothetical protein